MRKTLALLILCLCFSLYGHSQFTRYIIRFKDKGSNPFSLSNPLQYLTQRSIDRRIRYGIAIDSADLPVTPRYLDSIRLSGNVTIINVSKWLNQVAIKTNDLTAINKINSFPFVISTTPIAAKNTGASPVNKQLDPLPVVKNTGIDCYFFTDFKNAERDRDGKLKFRINDSLRPDFNLPNQLKLDYGANNTEITTPVALTNINTYTGRTTADFYDYGQSGGQVKIHNGDFLHNHGFRGEGMQMAILDAGFYHYLTLPTFDSVRNNNQILGTWDFVVDEASVNEDYYHGMQCFSTIAANMPGTFVGTAPKASFYLYRTEDIGSEYPVEEQNWAAGIERADSLGVDISSTSLGYSQFDSASLNHSYADMDGNTTISARAADMAASRGILVVAAAGNEGGNTWHYLITPSDADSSLCVGAVNTAGVVAGFSSYGPSSDGQVKPSVAAVGWNAVVANLTNGQPSINSGTSFACPNMAGLTTCLWQAFPEINNMGIIEALESSASRSNNPDDRMGYGIPDVKKAFVILQKKLYTGQLSTNGCNTDIQFSVKTDNTMSIEVERRFSTETLFTTLPGSLSGNGAYGLHNFTFTDQLNDLVLGEYEYRLKMIIGSDTSYYLDSFALNYTKSCTIPDANSIKIGPNPFSDHINLVIGRTQDAKIEVVVRNSIGQKVLQTGFLQTAGTQVTPIAMPSLSNGVYFLTVYIDNKKETTRKIVKR